MITGELLELLSDQKDPDLTPAVELAASDDDFLALLHSGLISKQDIFRYNCLKTLLNLAEKKPARLMPFWSNFAAMLEMENSYHRSIGMMLVSALAAAASEDQWKGLIERYLDLLDDESFVTARQTAQAAGRVALVRLELRDQILNRLFAIDRTHFPAERQALLKADIIQSVDLLPAEIADHGEVIAWVAAARDCSSPKTRSAARAFLKKRGL